MKIVFFSIRVSFTDTDDSQNSRGREATIFYSTLPLLPAHEHWDIYLQLCMWDDYHVFLIATLVFTRLLLDEIYHLIELVLRYKNFFSSFLYFAITTKYGERRIWLLYCWRLLWINYFIASTKMNLACTVRTRKATLYNTKLHNKKLMFVIRQSSVVIRQSIMSLDNYCWN